MQSEHHELTPLYEDGARHPPQHHREQRGFTYLRSQIPVTAEPAWQATVALQGVGSDELRDVLLHPTFRPMPRNAQVPV
ncbi:MAG TPA: hypothetical protein VGP82_13470, partial [Ktedonobacterales bacterium]|nr:hypothetical protein [Ktedonobacterales bacterium]